MSGHSMIAFIPNEQWWCRQPDPHVTLVYAGSTEGRTASRFNDLAKATIDVSRILRPFALPVIDLDVLGDEDPVDALILHATPGLILARSMVQHWNESQYKDYLPHATIGPEGSASSPHFHNASFDPHTPYPTELHFDTIGAFWDDKKLLFRLGAY